MRPLIFIMVTLWVCEAKAQQTPPPADSTTAVNNGDGEISIPLQVRLPDGKTVWVDFSSLLLEKVTDRDASQAQQANEKATLELATADLEQQTRMAVGTEDMVWWTRVQAALGAISLILLGLTLYFTKRTMAAASDTLQLAQGTLTEAESATVAAQASVKATEQMVRQDRAWVSIFTLRRTPHYDQQNNLVAHSTDFEVKNVGATPALNLMLGVGSFQTLPDTAAAASVVTRTIAEGTARVVGQGLSTFYQHRHSAMTLTQIRDNNADDYIYICAIYWTIYDECYITEWCCRTTVTELPGFRADADSNINYTPVKGLNRNYKVSATPQAPST